MTIKLLLLYLDADVHKRLALELRRRGYDAISAREVGMDKASDPEQLAFAVSEKRALLSFNVRDFVLLHSRYVAEGKVHYGVIVSPYQYSVGEALRRILTLLGSVSAEDMMNRLEYLSQWG